VVTSNGIPAEADLVFDGPFYSEFRMFNSQNCANFSGRRPGARRRYIQLLSSNKPERFLRRVEGLLTY